MEIVRLKGVTKNYLWGGNQLKKYGKKSSDCIAESWELSLNPHGISIIDSGKDKGKPLNKVFLKKDWGKLVKQFSVFPTLIKYIDSRDNLSIQVHPDDDFALKKEGSLGKTEMWFVVKAKKGASLYLGFKNKIKKNEVEKAIQNGKLPSLLSKFKVKEGDAFLIPSGTVHAINKGCLLLEIQENSDITYRMYDYQRKDKDGNTRVLHIDKALNVLKLGKYENEKNKKPLLFKTKYFSTYKHDLKGQIQFEENYDSFMVFNFYEGVGKINKFSFQKGDSFLVPAGNKVNILGRAKFLLTKIEK